MKGKTLITANASTASGGLDFYRKIKKGTTVDIVDANVPSPEGLEDRGGEVSFTVPGHDGIVETWRHDLVELLP